MHPVTIESRFDVSFMIGGAKKGKLDARMIVLHINCDFTFSFFLTKNYKNDG